MPSFKNNIPHQRLDLFLKEKLNVSRKETKRLLDAGRVLVNDRKVVIASWELERGDIVVAADDPQPSFVDWAKDYFLKVFYEDEDVIVVEKESGIPSERTPTSVRPSMPEIVYQYIKKMHPHLTHPYVLALHRLDLPTSGIMVYGKSKRALPLLADFKKHNIARLYVALVEGLPQKHEGVIRTGLSKTPRAKGKKMEIVAEEEGKRSITEYRVLQRYQHNTLVELNLKTGRTHQIRAHLAHLGHPVVGDTVYGPQQATQTPEKIALHASEIKFTHPVTLKKMHFRSKPPKHFRSTVKVMMKKALSNH